MRRLENKILKLKMGSQIALGSVVKPIHVSISQFYGIEINDFAVTVAKTALWIAESQMLKETEDIIHTSIEFLPLKSYANIIEGNSLRMDWEEVIPRYKLDFIMGNPPFIGARLMSADQKKDIKTIFGKLKGAGNLDYVSCWYKKAGDMIDNTKIKCAFVSTNSITQGEQVEILWKKLFEENRIIFNFAYKTFIWDSEASLKAHVYCVIIGFSQVNDENKYLYLTASNVKKVKNINAYLVDGPNVFIGSRRKPISEVKPMLFGSMPNDGGNLILTTEEKNVLVKQYPQSKEIIKRFVGAREFINKQDRWCLWIEPNNLLIASKIKPIMERVDNVKKHREKSSRKSTQELADVPYSFGENRQPKSSYLLVPSTSSEKRKYIPIGFLSENIISSNANLVVPEASLVYFAIMTSNVHMSWVRAVAGRLKSDYRYSASIVYNNFPWPIIEKEKYERLKLTGRKIIEARQLYPDWSYADLYNELTMPPELRKAHQENDKAVMEAYGFDWRKMSESECVAELMKMYEKLIEDK